MKIISKVKVSATAVECNLISKAYFIAFDQILEMVDLGTKKGDKRLFHLRDVCHIFLNAQNHGFRGRGTILFYRENYLRMLFTITFCATITYSDIPVYRLIYLVILHEIKHFFINDIHHATFKQVIYGSSRNF